MCSEQCAQRRGLAETAGAGQRQVVRQVAGARDVTGDRIQWFDPTGIALCRAHVEDRQLAALESTGDVVRVQCRQRDRDRAGR